MRISFRISSVLSKVEPEPDLHTGSGSDENVPAPTVFGSATLALYLLREALGVSGKILDMAILQWREKTSKSIA